jgi:hypothetical protein
MPAGRNGRRATRSVDVLVEVGGAPDDDHPDRQHESDCQNCEHLQFPPCRNLLSRLGSFYAKPGGRTIPIKPIRDGHSPQCRSGKEEVFKQNRRRRAPQMQRLPRRGRYRARNAHYVRLRLGAPVGSARRCVARFADAVVRIRSGPEESSWTFSQRCCCSFKTTNGRRREFPKTARGRALGPSPLSRLSRVLRAI